MKPAQTTNNILMIRPASFGFNTETAANNSFQSNEGTMTKEEISRQAMIEFDTMVTLLQEHGINVIVVEDTLEPYTPDAVFPNNWVSFHEDGLVISYPMFSTMRRQERRPDIIATLAEHYTINRDYTFEHYEEDGLFLEGTGSMILDRTNRIVYACISQRTDISLLDKWCVLMDYRKIHFIAMDRHNKPIYHTNVMMALGQTFAVICLETITNLEERKQVIKALQLTNKEIIDISYDQMEHFAGNMLEVKSKDGDPILVMSATAYDSLFPNQIETLQNHASIITPAIDTIEKYGGGSVRCMMAEVFLPLHQ